MCDIKGIRDMAHTWHIHMNVWYESHSWHGSFVTWLIRDIIRDMVPSWNGSCVTLEPFVAWLICEKFIGMCDMTAIRDMRAIRDMTVIRDMRAIRDIH